MKHLPLIAAWLMAILVAAGRPQGKQAPDSKAAKERLATSFATILFELAGERYEDNSKRNEIWIFSAHPREQNPLVERYFDGRYHVVSLPAAREQIAGICNYVTHYNSMNLEKVDALVLEGRVRDARALCELMQHFDVCGTLASAVKPRLELLAKWPSGEGDVAYRKKFAELKQGLTPSLFVAIEQRPEKTSTNLLEVHRDPLPSVEFE